MVALYDHVAEITVELDSPLLVTIRAERDQIAAFAGDMKHLFGRVVGEASRFGADLGSREDLAGRNVDGRDGARVSKRDVRAAVHAFDDTTRLVVGVQRDLEEERPLRDIDNPHAVAIRIGGNRRLTVAR
jgi:hypothetical protein